MVVASVPPFISTQYLVLILERRWSTTGNTTAPLRPRNRRMLTAEKFIGVEPVFANTGRSGRGTPYAQVEESVATQSVEAAISCSSRDSLYPDKCLSGLFIFWSGDS